MNWLDTETKAILQKDHEPKLAPPRVAEFGLVVLRKGKDQERLVRAICRINNCPEPEAFALAQLPEPVTINPGLSEEEAFFGQFELICCDSIAVFVRSEVLLARGQREYLDALFKKVLESPEFRPTRIDVLEVPATEAGETFADQFLGCVCAEAERPLDEFSLWVPYKKAKMMKHWAARVGAQVQCESVPSATDKEDDV
jgi:hypothetical protein